MAKLLSGSPLHTARGKIGNVVLRGHQGEVVVQLAPEKTKLRPPSPAQQAQRERFWEAKAYANGVLADPLQREVYQKLGRERKRPPNALLIQDFLTPPSVDRIDTTGYNGKPGGMIRVLASDDIEVVAVSVSLRLAGGATLEQGSASLVHGIWVYTATVAALAGEMIVEVTAKDRPQHTAMAKTVCTIG